MARDFVLIDNFNFVDFINKNHDKIEQMFTDAGYIAVVRQFEFDVLWRD